MKDFYWVMSPINFIAFSTVNEIDNSVMQESKSFKIQIPISCKVCVSNESKK